MTYQSFFNLDDAPFRLPPDPEYYFPSKRHSEALETLLYCVETGEGFVQITGKPGVGKTLLIRSFLGRLGDDVHTALILHPRLEAEELFKVILEDLGLSAESMAEMSKESLLRSFRDILLQSAQQGYRTVVIIDEAQEIPEKTLEELRLLSNLETEKAKLLQIILVGQPELEEKLNQAGLKQLHQRITNRYRLDTLTLDETVNYIHHRLKVAGGGNISRFSPDIIRQVHALSDGVPRIINTLCERSLMAAYVDGKSTVGREHLDHAVQSLEYNLESSSSGSNGKKYFFFFLLLVLIAAGTALYFSNAPFRKLVKLKTGQLVASIQGLQSGGISPSKKLQEQKTTEKTGRNDTKQLAGQDEQSGSAANTDSHTQNATAAPDPSQKTPLRTEQKAAAGPVVQTDGKVALQHEAVRKNDEKTREMDAQAPGNPALLAPGWKNIVILQKKGQALLFQYNAPEPVKKLVLPAETTLENGIYLLGRKKDTPFLFNHRSFFSWQQKPSLAVRLWAQFAEDKTPPVLPVVVTSSATDQVSEQMELSTVRDTVKNWAAAFDRQDIDKLMPFYDDSLVNYHVFRNRPRIKSHAEVAAKKRKIFEKNKAVSLQISEPVCVINSEDPSQAMALFYQRFISSSYRDTGIKVLYLRRTGSSSTGKPPWVITGRLWLPAADKKKQAASD